jgi:[ribosomal protein S18]-alanine N-acetyltransferase
VSAILQSYSGMRPMTQEDIEPVYAIERRSYSHPWTEGILRDCLRVGYNCWVYCDEGEILGYGIISVAAGEAHVLNLCVRPESQGAGVGRHILTHLVALARRHGADTMLLEVRASNRAAIALYESAGFNEIGQRHGYYPGHSGREDALVLAKVL